MLICKWDKSQLTRIRLAHNVPVSALLKCFCSALLSLPHFLFLSVRLFLFQFRKWKEKWRQVGAPHQSAAWSDQLAWGMGRARIQLIDIYMVGKCVHITFCYAYKEVGTPHPIYTDVQFPLFFPLPTPKNGEKIEQTGPTCLPHYVWFMFMRVFPPCSRPVGWATTQTHQYSY